MIWELKWRWQGQGWTLSLCVSLIQPATRWHFMIPAKIFFSFSTGRDRGHAKSHVISWPSGSASYVQGRAFHKFITSRLQLSYEETQEYCGHDGLHVDGKWIKVQGITAQEDSHTWDLVGYIFYNLPWQLLGLQLCWTEMSLDNRCIY